MTTNGSPSLARLAELCRIDTESAVKAGAQQADTCASFGRSINVSRRDRGGREARLVVQGGVGIRAYASGGMGYASTMLLDEDSAREAGVRAARLAQAAQPDPHFVSLPEPQPAPVAEVPGLFDERVVALEVADVVRHAEALAALIFQHAPEAVLGYGGVGITAPAGGPCTTAWG